MRKILILILFTLPPLWLAGCSVYKVDIRQGNTLEAEQIARLQSGMSKQQVLFLLGTPLVRDPFHPNRWDYIYSYKPGGDKLNSQHLTLYFDGDTLSQIDKSAFTGHIPPKKPSDKTE